MGFDFPSSPSQGQLFQPPGGPNYVYSNGVWTASTGQRAMISDTPPSGAVAGDLWWESDSGNLYVYYNDGDSSQWVQANTPALNPNTITNIVQTMITSSATYTAPVGLKFLEVTCFGGGGAGGGAPASSSGLIGLGSGGNAGAKAYSFLTAAAVGASQAMTVGAGGAGAVGANGGAGGTTSFGSLVSAAGGPGGSTQGPGGGYFFSAASTGAVASTAGQIRGSTPLGDAGLANPASNWAHPGNGGSNELGGGANGFITGTTPARSDGNSGRANTGGGGGGSLTVGTGQAATSGGAGGSGVIILKEYF